MESFAFPNVFNNAVFYEKFRGALFLKYQQNIVNILSGGRLLLERMETMDPGQSLLIKGMNLNLYTPLTVIKSGRIDESDVDGEDFTFQRLSTLTASYLYENRDNFPELYESLKTEVLRIIWNNTKPNFAANRMETFVYSEPKKPNNFVAADLTKEPQKNNTQESTKEAHKDLELIKGPLKDNVSELNNEPQKNKATELTKEPRKNNAPELTKGTWKFNFPELGEKLAQFNVPELTEVTWKNNVSELLKGPWKFNVTGLTLETRKFDFEAAQFTKTKRQLKESTIKIKKVNATVLRKKPWKFNTPVLTKKSWRFNTKVSTKEPWVFNATTLPRKLLKCRKFNAPKLVQELQESDAPASYDKLKWAAFLRDKQKQTGCGCGQTQAYK